MSSFSKQGVAYQKISTVNEPAQGSTPQKAASTEFAEYAHKLATAILMAAKIAKDSLLKATLYISVASFATIAMTNPFGFVQQRRALLDDDQ